ncbi:cation efflux system protein CusF, partial [Klebsiella pneumoniae]|uniref:cation efflux system protein CusF n=1 Tax=Klebsiella pneumoniae TaxID=573 RepID=UPI001FAF94D9
MRNSLKAVLFGAFSVMFSAGLHAETHQHGDMNAASDASVQQVIKGTGVVKDIDMNSKKITISHEAIPAVGWPAMTMRFTFVNADDALMNPLMILVKIIKLRWIHILSYDQMV